MGEVEHWPVCTTCSGSILEEETGELIVFTGATKKGWAWRSKTPPGMYIREDGETGIEVEEEPVRVWTDVPVCRRVCRCEGNKSSNTEVDQLVPETPNPSAD